MKYWRKYTAHRTYAKMSSRIKSDRMHFLFFWMNGMCFLRRTSARLAYFVFFGSYGLCLVSCLEHKQKHAHTHTHTVHGFIEFFLEHTNTGKGKNTVVRPATSYWRQFVFGFAQLNIPMSCFGTSYARVLYILFFRLHACVRGGARAHTPFQLCVFFDAKNSSYVGPGQWMQLGPQQHDNNSFGPDS